MSELSGKPLETCFEVVVRYGNKVQADNVSKALQCLLNCESAEPEVREVAK